MGAVRDRDPNPPPRGCGVTSGVREPTHSPAVRSTARGADGPGLSSRQTGSTPSPIQSPYAEDDGSPRAGKRVAKPMEYFMCRGGGTTSYFHPLGSCRPSTSSGRDPDNLRPWQLPEGECRQIHRTTSVGQGSPENLPLPPDNFLGVGELGVEDRYGRLRHYTTPTPGGGKALTTRDQLPEGGSV